MKNANEMQKLRSFVQKTKVGMLTTVENGGSLHSRPMVLPSNGFQEQIWLCTKLNVAKVIEVEHDHHVNLSFSDPALGMFASITGTAKLVLNRDKSEELWDDTLKEWFPDGPDESNLGLLCVTIQKAEFWAVSIHQKLDLVG